MNKKILSIPFNGDLKFIARAIGLGCAAEVYSAMPGNLFAHNLSVDKFDHFKFKHLLGLCKKSRTPVNLLLNAPCLADKELREIFDFIGSMKGLTSITLADPLVISEFKRRCKNVELHASVIMELDSVEKLDKALALGVSSVVLPAWLNRNAVMLSRMAKVRKRAPQLKIKLMANAHCASHCLFSHWHYLLAMRKDRGAAPPSGIGYKTCFNIAQSPEQLLKLPFIRPEDSGFYTKNKYADILKIVYRNDPSARLANICRAYHEGKYRGNLRDIVEFKHLKGYTVYMDNALIPAGFINKVSSCSGECGKCGYCGKVASKAIVKHRRPAGL
jgi:hypothetical protein